MSTGIPCCKSFTITIGSNPMDCGTTPTDPSSLVWTFVNGAQIGNTGDSSTLGSASGLSGSFSYSGTTGQADGRIFANFCNNTTNPITFRLTFSINYNLVFDVVNCAGGLQPYAAVSSYDFFVGTIWYTNGGSGTASPTFDIVIPPCTSDHALDFYWVGVHNCDFNTVEFNGTFTVEIV